MCGKIYREAELEDLRLIQLFCKSWFRIYINILCGQRCHHSDVANSDQIEYTLCKSIMNIIPLRS